MKYRREILYFATVAAIAIVAWALSPSNAARHVLTVIAVLSFVVGIIGFEMYEGWAKQKLRQRSRRTILFLLSGATMLITAVYYLLICFKLTSALTPVFGLVGILCISLFFRSVGALLFTCANKK